MGDGVVEMVYSVPMTLCGGGRRIGGGGDRLLLDFFDRRDEMELEEEGVRGLAVPARKEPEDRVRSGG